METAYFTANKKTHNVDSTTVAAKYAHLQLAHAWTEHRHTKTALNGSASLAK